MPTGTYNHSLFGKVTFETEHREKWVRGDHITFTKGFDIKDITKVTIPQLVGIKGVKDGVLPFHKKGHAQLKKSFIEIQTAGLLPIIKTCGGSLNFRLRRPISGKLSKLPSQHAFGIAIDLNEDDGKNGQTVAPLAPIFKANGFTWGKAFNDPMHFEISKFV